jgi:hypothetical protein
MYNIARCSLINAEIIQKVTAIKAIRALTGMGLATSKTFVEGLSYHHDIIHIPTTISTIDIQEGITLAQKGGIRIILGMINNQSRKEIANQIAKIITFASISGEYDIVKSLVTIMETQLPNNNDTDGSGDFTS